MKFSSWPAFALALVLTALTVRAQIVPTPDADLVFVEGETATVRAAIGQKIKPLVAGKNFEELDRMADDLRTSKAQTAGGMWHLLCFYEELSEFPSTVSDETYTTRLEFFHQWISSRPTSITARVALARCYMHYAWHARGNGYASTVAPTGQRLFEDRLKKAALELDDAKKLDAKCPVWWDTMQFAALGLSWSSSTYNRVFDEAVAYEPNYTFFYNNKVVFLLPRWYGREGDWQKFAAESADKAGGEAGDILYARIGWRVHERRFYNSFIGDSHCSMPRVEKGLKAIVKSHPDSLTAASELAYLSYQARDLAVAKTLFDRIGNKIDKEVWGDDKAKFIRAKARANGFDPNAAATPPSGPGK
jgi:hypothetical protein